MLDTQQLPIIRGLLPMTLIDWPGHMSAVIFLPGCNFRCPYCHSGSLLEPAPQERIPFEQIEQYLTSKKNWLDGVVICGGEPTLHEHLPDLCREIRRMGFGVKLDTNGTHPEVLAALLDEGLLGGVSMDVKTVLDGRMTALARREVDLAALERSIDLLIERWRASAGELEVEFRTTCCPAFVDEDIVRWIAARVLPQGEDGNGPPYVLQRFSAEHCLDPAMREVKPYNGAELESLLNAAREVNRNARLRGQ